MRARQGCALKSREKLDNTAAARHTPRILGTGIREQLGLLPPQGRRDAPGPVQAGTPITSAILAFAGEFAAM